ncbi:diguanylate cyclase domain-containing protein [Halopseudomonas sp.]|uniref:diguanylate cyclase domain-containing protein n=1 Tax=Halopseudomonas sp. TaxID=2901191 RepID=UPI0030025A85
MNSAYPKPIPANALDLVLDAVCMVDETGTFVYLSAACERIFGYAPEELIGRTFMELVHPDDLEITLQTADRVRNGELIPHFENRYVRKDGAIVHIMWSARWSEEDKLRIAVARDITERKQHETRQALVYAISEAANKAGDLNTLCSQVHQLVNRLLPVSLFSLALHDPASGEMGFRYHHSDNDKPPTELSSPVLPEQASGDSAISQGTSAEQAQWLGVPLVTQGAAFGALVLHRKPGFGAFTENDRALLQYVSTQIAAAVQRVQMQTQLQFLSQHDQLTGLPNRTLLADRLAMASLRAQRDSSQLAVLFLDLNRFKEINDSLGHAVGDQLLQQVAGRLSGVVRASDTVARMGGDEFVILLENILHSEHACQVAEKVCAALDAPYLIEAREVRCGASIGIAIPQGQLDDAHHLLRSADRAMYRAKELGGSRYVLAE